MSPPQQLTPAGSQTVGPYFRIGLQPLIDDTPEINEPTVEAIRIRGRVLDRDGAPVPDAMLEFWSADRAGTETGGFPEGFRRAATDLEGRFFVCMRRPARGEAHAPHMLVLVFARGLLRHLLSRVYFEDEPANASDPVLLGVPAERRKTLLARPEGENSYFWDVILQGDDETVFFAW